MTEPGTGQPQHSGMPFETFLGRFALEFNASAETLHRGSSLFDELELDSFDVFRLLLWLEVTADVPYPPEELPPLFTLGDVYDYYSLLVAQR